MVKNIRCRGAVFSRSVTCHCFFFFFAIPTVTTLEWWLFLLLGIVDSQVESFPFWGSCMYVDLAPDSTH